MSSSNDSRSTRWYEKCILTQREYPSSSSEVKIRSNLGLSRAQSSGIERLRMLCSTIPEPSFNISGEFGYQLSSVYSSVPQFHSLQTGSFPEINSSKEFFSSLRDLHRSLGFVHSDMSHVKCEHFACTEMQESFECLLSVNCSFCYECVFCQKCEDLFFSRFCKECTNSYFLESCSDCDHCLFCSGLEGVSYAVFNQEVSKDEYFETLKGLELESYEGLRSAWEKFESFLHYAPVFEGSGLDPGLIESEDTEFFSNFVSLDSVNSGNIFGSYSVSNCFDLAFCKDIKNSLGCALVEGKGSSLSQVLLGTGIKRLSLSSSCRNSEDLLGCVGLENQKFCVLNWQLSQEEYFRVREDLLKMLRIEGKSDVYVQASFELLPYNRSIANALFPLTRVQAELLGFAWDSKADEIMGLSSLLSSNIELCEISADTFLIDGRESEFLRRRGVALPQRSQRQRFYERLQLLIIQNGHKVKCAASGKSLYSYGSSKRPSISLAGKSSYTGAA